MLCYFILSLPSFERRFLFPRIRPAVVGTKQPSEARLCSFGDGEGLLASGLENDNNKREVPLQGNGAQSKAKRDRGFKSEASSEPTAHVVPDSGKIVSLLPLPSFSIDSTSRDFRNLGSHTRSDHASTKVDSSMMRELY